MLMHVPRHSRPTAASDGPPCGFNFFGSRFIHDVAIMFSNMVAQCMASSSCENQADVDIYLFLAKVAMVVSDRGLERL